MSALYLTGCLLLGCAGLLALNGPTRETKLDPAGTVTVPRTAVVALIDAVETSWPGR